MVADLPGIWHAPTTTATDRKRMLRCLIRDVSLDSFSSPGQTRLHLRWQTGCITTLTVRRPTSGDVHRLESTLVAYIMDTRRRHHISTACPITPRDHQPRGDGLVSVHVAAEQFQTSRSTILNWARKG